jgi:hypothetical protein
VKVRIQFQSDGSNYSTGLQLDNVAVTGTYAPGYEPGPVGGPVPEPTTWAMMIIGFFGAGAFVRRERPVFA